MIPSESKTITKTHGHGDTADPRTAADKLMYLPDPDPDIEDARIEFALKWRLKKHVRFLVTDPQLPSGEEWGKYETFRDEDGRLVLLLHNYASSPPKILNMVQVGILCDDYRRKTWAGRYSSMTELRARLEAAEGRGDKFSAARHLLQEPPTPRRSAHRGRGKATA